MVGQLNTHRNPKTPWVYFRYVDPNQPLQVIRYGTTYKLEDILKQQSDYLMFWKEFRAIFPQGDVQESVYLLPGLQPGSRREKALPVNRNIILEMTRPGILKTYFVNETNSDSFSWFDLASGGVYVFDKVPPYFKQFYKRWHSSDSGELIITNLIRSGEGNLTE